MSPGLVSLPDKSKRRLSEVRRPPWKISSEGLLPLEKGGIGCRQALALWTLQDW